MQVQTSSISNSISPVSKDFDRLNSRYKVLQDRQLQMQETMVNRVSLLVEAQVVCRLSCLNLGLSSEDADKIISCQPNYQSLKNELESMTAEKCQIENEMAVIDLQISALKKRLESSTST
jgi:septal ring factor EnvC (AmiA/AmiB activator)